MSHDESWGGRRVRAFGQITGALVGLTGCADGLSANPTAISVSTGIGEGSGSLDDGGSATGSDDASPASDSGTSGGPPMIPGSTGAANGSDSSGSSSGDQGPNPDCIGLPPCQSFGGQAPDCTYAPVVGDPAYEACSGPVVWVDVTHDNWHQITPESQDQPGRYWGFASLLFADGYDLRDSETSLASLTPGQGPDILVIANAFVPDPAGAALTDPEADAVATWVEAGGSLLLVFDHPPFDKVGNLLSHLGLQRQPQGADTASNDVFRRSDGTLGAASFVTNGMGGDEVVDEVTSFRGSSFDVIASPPANAAHTAIMTFGPGSTANVGGNNVSIAGRLQGAVVELGAGRVVVLAEAAMLTAQVSAGGNVTGLHQTPDNEQFLLNVMHWLAGAS